MLNRRIRDYPGGVALKRQVFSYEFLSPHPSMGFSTDLKQGKVSWLSRPWPPSRPILNQDSGLIDQDAHPGVSPGSGFTVAGQQRIFTAFPFPVSLFLKKHKTINKRMLGRYCGIVERYCGMPGRYCFLCES